MKNQIFISDSQLIDLILNRKLTVSEITIQINGHELIDSPAKNLLRQAARQFKRELNTSFRDLVPDFAFLDSLSRRRSLSGKDYAFHELENEDGYFITTWNGENKTTTRSMESAKNDMDIMVEIDTIDEWKNDYPENFLHL